MAVHKKDSKMFRLQFCPYVLVCWDLTFAFLILGTPGRVFDMISRKVLRTYDIKMFVLDEADEMLSRGFKDQIYDVFRHLNSNIQVKKKLISH